MMTPLVLLVPILLMPVVHRPVVHPAPPVISAAPWGWPLRGRPVVVRDFQPPPQPWAAGHRGVDLLGKPGGEVVSAGPGIVIFAGQLAGRGVVSILHFSARSASGRLPHERTSPYLRTTYEPVNSRVRPGDRIRKGQLIGALSTDTSHCAPQACLHWGALIGRGYFDPLSLLSLRPRAHRRSRLLPLAVGQRATASRVRGSAMSSATGTSGASSISAAVASGGLAVASLGGTAVGLFSRRRRLFRSQLPEPRGY
jgi:hypothetical protein